VARMSTAPGGVRLEVNGAIAEVVLHRTNQI
jgi:hypothetical protein